jgi:hypothetical protein
VRARLRSVAGALARTVAQVVPDRLLVRLLPRSLRWDAAHLPVAEGPDASIRLYIAPANSAGQAFRWARATEAVFADVGAVNLMTTDAASDRYAFEADVAVPAPAFVLASGWRRRQQAALEAGFTHALIESGRFAFGSVPASTPLRVAERLERKGMRVGLLWHGSDIRVPSEHARLENDSPFGARGHYPARSVEILERNAREHRRLVERSTFPVFVSTPGLLDVPRAQWLPVVVEPERWHTEESLLARERPVVAYVPSNSPMKGDASIDEALTALEGEGVIEYRRLGGIPSAEMPAVYGGADIVLDQFRLGDYGVAACEAMAAGRIVVGHVSDAVRTHVRDVTGVDLPIVEARLDTVRDTVTAIVSDPGRWRGSGAAGREFVRRVHDGRLSAGVLAPFLGLDAPTPEGQS